MKKLLVGGSPCTYWSIAQRDRETDAKGSGWELFENYVIALKKFKPDYFIYENNNSISKGIKEQITKELGIKNQTIDSALVSPQQRKREYWYNAGIIPLPQDRKIKLQDILISGTAEREKAYCLDASYYKGGNIKSYFVKHRRTQIFEAESNGKKSVEVTNGRVEIEGVTYKANLKDGIYYPRNMNEIEAARLQTMPDNYCKAICKTEAIKCYGNGWTAETIIHILKHMLRAVEKTERIVVVSLYDGIGTARYCLDKMGFQNVIYYAFEIAEAPIKCAKDNYPDIIQCGDAFDIRKEDWKLDNY